MSFQSQESQANLNLAANDTLLQLSRPPAVVEALGLPALIVICTVALLFVIIGLCYCCVMDDELDFEELNNLTVAVGVQGEVDSGMGLYHEKMETENNSAYVRDRKQQRTTEF